MNVELMIDGKTVYAEAGQSLMVVAAENGVYIPSLCYVKDKTPLGTCRTCSVRVNGNIMAACTVLVAKDMDVRVNEPDVSDMRKGLVEALFSEGNHNCPSCEKSGRCELQAVGYELEMVVSRFPYRFPVRVQDHASDKIWLERDRCIFCQRCVEFVRDHDTGKKIFSISGRGRNARIEIDVELANAMPDAQVKYAVQLCPVGTILEKGVGYDQPVGQRKFDVKPLRERVLSGETP